MIPAFSEWAASSKTWEDESPWLVRTSPAEFTWWPGRLSQRVWATPGPLTADGLRQSRVHIETTIVRGIPWPGAKGALIAVSQHHNSRAALSALLVHPAQARIGLYSAVNVADDTVEGGRRVVRDVAGWVCVMQAGEALDTAEPVAAAVGGTPDYSGPPGTDPRLEPDPGIAECITFANREGQDLDLDLSGAGAFLDRVAAEKGSRRRFTAQVPFDGKEVGPVGGVLSDLQMVPHEHPVYGSGVLVTVAVPAGLGSLAAHMAMELNSFDYYPDWDSSWFPVYSLGAWVGDDATGSLLHRTFVPAPLVSDQTVALFVRFAELRSGLAHQYLSRRGVIAEVGRTPWRPPRAESSG